MTRLVLLALLIGLTIEAGEIPARNSDELRNAVGRARPGDVIKLASGKYQGGVWLEKISGTREKPIVIEAADPEKPPVFIGGREALHFVDCNYVTLRCVSVEGQASNGINADDGGSFDTPSRGMVFERVTIENIGPKGNHDALKLSGLDGFAVRDCRFSGWGGSAIDMVGCHQGVIEGCRFLGKAGFSQDTGIQAKGGCREILIQHNFFRDAGQRSINLGGSTGLAFFRPKLQDYEAKDIEVAGNTFIGSPAPIAYVTSQDCKVHHNTFVYPTKWVMRILQEQPTDKFKPCADGVFEANLVVFDKQVQTFVNVGPDTSPETFVFAGNAWFCSDGERRPTLPTKEVKGIYQVKLELVNAGTPELKVTSTDSRLAKVGAHAWDPGTAAGRR